MFRWMHRSLLRSRALAIGMMVALIIPGLGAPVASAATIAPGATGELDCNGQSPIQRVVRATMNCTDVRGFPGVNNANTWGGRFYDNGTYIGHDEPDMTFYSGQPGSGNNVTWTETLGTDPAAAPTVSTPGQDVAHWAELSVAPWFSMAICDPNSYPQAPCAPLSDANGTTAGSAFMEMQLYPPGMPPFVDSTSCDDTHWCAALTIDSLECTAGFATCNSNCIEPVNFAFIQTNGVPAGPPSPQLANLASFTPNTNTLLMNPGDKIQVHLFDAPVPGGGHAFTVGINDLSTGQSGFMQASAANGFMNTSAADCSGTPFNFEPEFSTASAANYIPWAALQTNVSTQFEIGHFEPCTALSQPALYPLSNGAADLFYNHCSGPYEAAAPGGDGVGGQPEAGDAFCYPAGDTHGSLQTAPDVVTGCMDNYYQNGDLDYDGTPYWPEWPTGQSATALLPGSFVEAPPLSVGRTYASFSFQTDAALSEVATCSAITPAGCAVPPPNAPGKFYPFWSTVTRGGHCALEFGNVATGPGVNDFGGDAQYGTNRLLTLGYPEFESQIYANTCQE